MATRKTVAAPSGKWKDVAEQVIAAKGDVCIPLDGRPDQSVRVALRYWLVPKQYTLKARREGDALIVRAVRRGAA